jgi:hypothetical protein
MEFTISCPIDGAIEVSIEDIDNVVLRESERADITFVCPHCGTEITVTAIVPTFLMAAIEALADESDSMSANGLVVLSSDSGVDEGAETVDLEVVVEVDEDDPMLDAYCEYFRRQLSAIDSVDQALGEIDATT